MSRSFGLVAMVCSLAIVAVLMAMNMQKSGPTSKTARNAEAQATAAAGTINFSQAATELAAFHAENGTFAGAALPPSFGVTLARADAASYCLQSGIGASVQHFIGPAGPAAGGPC
jgi:type II secretory pathway pseudopilin PulG